MDLIASALSPFMHHLFSRANWGPSSFYMFVSCLSISIQEKLSPLIWGTSFVAGRCLINYQMGTSACGLWKFLLDSNRSNHGLHSG